jgi:hypothetical protein
MDVLLLMPIPRHVVPISALNKYSQYNTVKCKIVIIHSRHSIAKR